MSKRSIKQQAKYAEKKILEQNKDFYANIAESKFGSVNVKQHRRPLSLYIAAAVVAAVTLTFVLIFPLLEGLSKEYSSENNVVEDISISQFNSYIGKLEFVALDKYTYRYNRVYDSVSKDTLFLVLRVSTNEGIKASVYFYTNKFFEEYTAGFIDEKDGSFQANGFSMNYRLDITAIDELFNLFYYKAFGTYQKINIYIEHEQMCIGNQSNFFDFVKQSIKVKK